jgi:hypothetical protein
MSGTASTSDATTPSDTPSSSVVETPSAPAPSTPVDVTTPSSSDGKTDSQPSPSSGDSRQSDRDGLLAAVRSVVKTETTPAAEGDTPEDAATGTAGQDKAAAPGDQAPPPADTTSDDAPDPTEAELRKLRPETRKRFERLLSQRNEARQQFDQVKPELDQHRQLQGYLREHQLAPDDVNMLLGVGSALRRGDYQAFLNGVTPYVMVAQEALGIRIAPDLQKQVDDGLISEDAARDHTRTRHRAAQAEHRLKEQTQTTTADEQVRNVASIRSSVDQWEAGIRSRDPDYAHKADTVRRFSQALLQEKGVPQTPQQAVALVQAAYDEANKVLVSLRPRPQPTRPTPSSVHVATSGGTAEPSNMKEAVQMALQRMRRAS